MWLRDQEALVTDGPYGETKELLAGYFIVDCDTEERAVELAKHLQLMGADLDQPPSQLAHPVEVHPIMRLSGQEM